MSADKNRSVNYDDPDKKLGLYGKFIVARSNPAAQARHQGCNYFVLDLDHDPLALPAIATYADKAEAAGYVQLAKDLRRFLPDVPEFHSNTPH